MVGIVQLNRNISASNSPAKPIVIMVACEFFFASKDADIIDALVIQIYRLISRFESCCCSHLCINVQVLCNLCGDPPINC